MSKSLQEYIDWLDDRADLIWPTPAEPEKADLSPFVRPLSGIRAVTWDVYGTLLQIADGRFLLRYKQQLRMQIALEKTIKEFKMWHSMSRKPGAPWEYMLSQYNSVVDKHEMVSTHRKGDFPQINADRIWHKLLERLVQNGYVYDERFYGNLENLSEKVAYFFQSSLQGGIAAPRALKAMKFVRKRSLEQGLLTDAQPFTLWQLLRALKQQGKLPPLDKLFVAGGLTMSYQEGLRKPSPAIYSTCLERFEKIGIGPTEILHIGSRLRDDLAVAKQFGMRTALFAGDKESLHASLDDLKDPEIKPDRLLTTLPQLQFILKVS